MSTVPEGVDIKKIDYADQASLVAALQGQDALIITMSVSAPPDHQTKLIEAAATANVAWVLPNEWGYDTSNPGLRKDIPINDKHKYFDQIEGLGKSSWIGVTCSFWYEYSLSSGPATYGFDFKNRTVTFIDDGNTHINTSTWVQCGRAVAKLLAMKVLPDNTNDTSPCLTHYKNKFIYISSFNLSQRDILDSVMRVTGTTLDDWKIKHEDSPTRYKAGVEAMKKGDFQGFAQMMYTRVFYPDGSGNYEASKGLQNDVLGLPKEDLDEYTKIAVHLAEKSAPSGN
jgi:NmrA-like family